MSPENSAESEPVTGMAAVRVALQSRPSGERSIAWLARQLDLSRGAMLHWGNNVPEEWLRQISELTGVAPRVLRPDLAELFSGE